MRGSRVDSGNPVELFRRVRRVLQPGVLFFVVAITPLLLSGCAGLVSGANTTSNPPPPSALSIANVQAASTTTSTSLIVWTTNVAADSAVDYGTSTSYGSSTPLDSAMVTSHQVTLSGLAAGTTYYYQVNSTDSKSNHGHSGNHTFKTAGFSIAGTISPASGGSGATLALSGAASTATTADSLGNYTFAGLANGTYTIAPSRAGFTFTPSSQSTTVNGSDVTGVSFTDAAQTYSISGTISPTAGGSGATLTLSGAANATTTANSAGAYTFTGLASGSYTIRPSNPGYSFTPVNQNVTVSTVNLTGVNFTDSAAVAPTITTQPTNQTVTAGKTATFAVVAAGTSPLSYQWQKNGANIAGAVSASYTTPTTATSDSGSTFAVVVSNTAGTVTSAGATLTVNPATLVSIAVTPANPSITKGATQQFTATGTFSDSTTQVLSNAVWASGTGTVATISNTGLATAAGAGSSTISATVGSISGSTLLTVNPATLVSIAVTPANPSITKGATQQFTATGTFSDSTTQVLSNAVWASGTGTVATISNTGLATAAGAGSSTISATVGSISGSTLLTVTTAPTIQVSPTSISFGNAVVSTSLSQALIISNTGTATLTITQLTASGSATFSVSGFSLPLNVNAGKQTTITVTFLPTSVGSVSGAISIVSNAPTSPTSVGLSGTGIAATLTLGISPTSLSFGNVTTGTSSASQNVTITNTGNANVTISQVSVNGAGYSVTGGSTPVTLSPAQNLILTAQFSPTSAGTVSGNISIVSNATGSPASVSLSGTGVAPVQHSVALSWNASTSTVSGYNVYRSTVSGGPYTKLNSSLVATLNYTDSTVQNGTTYFYVTTAVDSSGSESVYSNEVSAPIP